MFKRRNRRLSPAIQTVTRARSGLYDQPKNRQPGYKQLDSKILSKISKILMFKRRNRRLSPAIHTVTTARRGLFDQANDRQVGETTARYPTRFRRS
mmetsp:Transcript_23557/g.51185  ORF Transcript_23557/g.51185 Transcript_23557/m.51185 type:complete len:96 (-) Transcript_23557:114-401(-)